MWNVHFKDILGIIRKQPTFYTTLDQHNPLTRIFLSMFRFGMEIHSEKWDLSYLSLFGNVKQFNVIHYHFLLLYFIIILL